MSYGKKGIGIMDMQSLLKGRDKMTIVVNRFSNWLGIVSMICMFVVIVFTNSDIFLRYVIKSGLPGNVTLCEILLVLAVFLGLPLAELSGSHVKMEFIFDRLPGRVRSAMGLFDRLICLCILALISYASISYAIIQFAKGEVIWAAAIQIVLWPARFGLALGVIVFFMLILVETVKAFKFILHKEKNSG